MMLGRAARRAGAVVGMFLALAACDEQTVGAATQPYEIVTQMRPESVDAYMQVYRKAYEVCAQARAALKLPPPAPLAALPADFVIKRSTYRGSGSSYLIRHEEFNVDMAEMTPQTGCKSRLASTLSETVGRGGKVYSQRREPDGHMEVEAPASLPAQAPTGNADSEGYTEKKTVGGIAMRCIGAALRGGITLDKCAADTNAGLLRDGVGQAIVLHAREVVPVFNTVVLTEPVSVQVGKPVNQERIALSGAK